MPDNKYCYPNTEVLVNKLNIKDREKLFHAEKELTFIRLQELQSKPIVGKFDFLHLKKIHKYIFQDIYEWVGKIRTVEIGKGNLFCTTSCIYSYGESVFNKYYPQCEQYKDDRKKFIEVLAENYADLNALHPFREGNGRAQREFARLVCLSCGYIFDLSCTTHEKMLQASRLSFEQADCSLLRDIFSNAVIPMNSYFEKGSHLKMLTADDLKIGPCDVYYYNYYDSCEINNIEKYNSIYNEKAKNNYQIVLAKGNPSSQANILSSEKEKKSGFFQKSVLEKLNDNKKIIEQQEKDACERKVFIKDDLIK